MNYYFIQSIKKGTDAKTYVDKVIPIARKKIEEASDWLMECATEMHRLATNFMRFRNFTDDYTYDDNGKLIAYKQSYINTYEKFTTYLGLEIYASTKKPKVGDEWK